MPRTLTLKQTQLIIKALGGREQLGDSGVVNFDATAQHVGGVPVQELKQVMVDGDMPLVQHTASGPGINIAHLLFLADSLTPGAPTPVRSMPKKLEQKWSGQPRNMPGSAGVLVEMGKINDAINAAQRNKTGYDSGYYEALFNTIGHARTSDAVADALVAFYDTEVAYCTARDALNKELAKHADIGETDQRLGGRNLTDIIHNHDALRIPLEKRTQRTPLTLDEVQQLNMQARSKLVTQIIDRARNTPTLARAFLDYANSFAPAARAEAELHNQLVPFYKSDPYPDDSVRGVMSWLVNYQEFKEGYRKVRAQSAQVGG